MYYSENVLFISEGDKMIVKAGPNYTKWLDLFEQKFKRAARAAERTEAFFCSISPDTSRVPWWIRA